MKEKLIHSILSLFSNNDLTKQLDMRKHLSKDDKKAHIDPDDGGPIQF